MKRSTTSRRRAARNSGASWSTAWLGGASTSKASASSGSHGSSDGSSRSSVARSRSSTTSSGSSQATPSSWRRSSRQVAYGVVIVYGSQVACSTRTPSARSRTSSIRRERPIPGSLTSSIRRPRPRRASSSACVICSSSRSRPISGNRTGTGPRAASRLSTTRPTETAWTGSALPLTVKGSRSVVSKRVLDRSSTAGVV